MNVGKVLDTRPIWKSIYLNVQTVQPSQDTILRMAVVSIAVKTSFMMRLKRHANAKKDMILTSTEIALQKKSRLKFLSM